MGALEILWVFPLSLVFGGAKYTFLLVVQLIWEALPHALLEGFLCTHPSISGNVKFLQFYPGSTRVIHPRVPVCKVILFLKIVCIGCCHLQISTYWDIAYACPGLET